MGMLAKKIYISGPINGILEHESNFKMIKTVLEMKGYEVLDPHDVPACEDGTCHPKLHNGHSWGCFLKYDIIAMLECDAIYMLPGWEQSHGARLELSVAAACGLEVFYHDLASYQL